MKYEPPEYNPKEDLYTFDKICKSFRGIRKEELDKLNPEYSCIICKLNKTCTGYSIENSCPNCELLTEEEFALQYNF